MGIQNLLPELRSIERDAHVKDYKGLRAGVDTFGWLHRGAYSCSYELIVENDTSRLVKFIEQRARLLLDHGVTPVLVFDGARLPAKRATEEGRRDSRKRYLQMGKEFLQNGNRQRATECFQRAVSITSEISHDVIQHMRKNFGGQVECVVAPYEADAQLAYLDRRGLVDVVITEDSDLLAFNCRRVLFKLDKYGSGKEIELQRLPQVRGLSFRGWNADMFLSMCILCGCDYLESLSGVGVKRAHRLVQHARTAEKIVRRMKIEGIPVTEDYLSRFHFARLAFKYQRVFDVVQGRLVHLEALPHELSACAPEEIDEFAGPDLPPAVASGVCGGRVHPMTHEPFVRAQRGVTQRSIMEAFRSKPPSSAAKPTAAESSRSQQEANGAGLSAIDALSRFCSDRRAPPPLPTSCAADAPRRADEDNTANVSDRHDSDQGSSMSFGGGGEMYCPRVSAVTDHPSAAPDASERFARLMRTAQSAGASHAEPSPLQRMRGRGPLVNSSVRVSLEVSTTRTPACKRKLDILEGLAFTSSQTSRARVDDSGDGAGGDGTAEEGARVCETTRNVRIIRTHEVESTAGDVASAHILSFAEYVQTSQRSQ